MKDSWGTKYIPCSEHIARLCRYCGLKKKIGKEREITLFYFSQSLKYSERCGKLTLAAVKKKKNYHELSDLK